MELLLIWTFGTLENRTKSLLLSSHSMHVMHTNFSLILHLLMIKKIKKNKIATHSGSEHACSNLKLKLTGRSKT